jgi:lysophospholipase L1-like esterase
VVGAVGSADLASAQQGGGSAGDAPAFDDHRNMMDQLGITRLRPGADPNRQDTFDEATANPYADSLPDALTMNDGAKVTRADQWPARRAEIVELFEREVYGRVPPNAPQVTWEVTSEERGVTAGVPTITRQLVGHVDNRAFPDLTVDIQARFTVPVESDEPRPIMLEFGGFGPFGGFGRRGGRPGGSPPWTEQAIAHGWAYGSINPNSIQPDNNRLRTGVIGLANKGEPRKPDDWGALRAWGWGVSRLIDFFADHPEMKIDPAKVGIEGVSRYGKAALVAAAFDPRVAVAFVASSGEGGAKLHRHIFGEAVENLTGGGYYWMAGNFLKYGAAEADFGAKTAADLPVDSHELIALCAPRPCFISYGIVERGDPPWVDARGSYMAGALATPVYELLGKQGFGDAKKYLTAPLPAVNELVGGELAWRQHDGGHEATPNWPTFFEWVAPYVAAPAPPQATVAADAADDDDSTASPSGTSPAPPRRRGPPAADQPIERPDANSKLAHEQLLAKAQAGGIDLYFVGDSITRRWGTSDAQYADLLANWKQNFFGWNAGNFGWGGDTTQNILWRLQNGEFDGVHPKAIVILAGTNNVGPRAGDDALVEDVSRGVAAIVDACRAKAPRATIILTAIFPRNDNLAAMPTINAINARLAKLADGQRVRWLDVNDKLADESGKLRDGMMHDGLHPTVKGYQAWADGLKPLLTEILGPPAATDHAPPPTGDPSAAAAGQAAAGTPNTAAAATGTPQPPRVNTAIVPRLNRAFNRKHDANVEVAKAGNIELLLMGDSITDFWRNEGGPFAGKEVFDRAFGQWKTANFGIAGDTTQGVLWRLQNGEGAGFAPRAVMMMIGTNNLSARNTPTEIAMGVAADVFELRKDFPEAKILLLGIFPRGPAGGPARGQIAEINRMISALHDGAHVFYLDIGARFLAPDGSIPRDVMSDALHPTKKGYEIWADAVQEPLAELMK